MERFCEQVLAEITEDGDAFWVHEAVRHASFTVHPEHGVRLLGGVLRDRARLKVFDLLMPGAASKLGAKAAYPNPLLAELITRVDPDADPEYLRELHYAAYGGYISTVTGFQPVFDERLRVQARGETLSAEKAERFIARWRAEHPDETPH